MKKIALIGSLALFGCILGCPKNVVSKAEDYSINIEEKHNLANWSWDWDVVEVGSGKTDFSSGHLRMENINTASSNYALYKTHKFNEFRVDMRANLNLPSPSDLQIEGNDWANLYFTYFIDFDDATQVENAAMAACPWCMNKGWLSVCFERIGGNSHVQLLVNETFDGNGGARYYLNDPANGKGSCVSSVNFVDNQYHWFTIEATSVKPVNPNRVRYNEVGTRIRVLIDGAEQCNYFMADEYYSNTHDCIENIPFHEQKGYFGFWASSSYSGGYNTANTGVAVDIDQLQVTSYDDVQDKDLATPYERCARPAFHLEPISNFAPEAEYEAGEEFELNMNELFTYDGDLKLSYSATCKGEPIGAVRNGYFVWTPEEEGKVNIVFTATDGELTAENEVRFNVVAPFVPPTPSSSSQTSIEETSSQNEPEPVNKGGCGGSIAATSGLIAIISILGFALTAKRKYGDK